MTSKRKTKMSGNYKPRVKTEEEKTHDLIQVLNGVDKCIEQSVQLVDEIEECGDTWISTVRDARSSINSLGHAATVMKQKKVGEYFDVDKGITGDYYYNDI